MSFVFYDTETTGIETKFDQILQFAAIHTDLNFVEIGRFEIRSRLSDRVVVAPGALNVTGMSIRDLIDQTLPSHFQMVNAIQERLKSWSPAVFIGHNSLGFDEHLLRSALWKSLHRPYLTNTDGNARADTMRIVQAIAALRPDVMVIPTKENGKPSFRLEDLAPANGFDHAKAHDALGDVEATIFLAKLISEKAPDLWSAFMRFSQKAAVTDFILNEPVFGLIESSFGRTSAFVVTSLGKNPENSSEYYAFDLSVDPEELGALSDRALATRLKKSPKPFRRIKANACPLLTDFDQAPETAAARSLPLAELLRRAEAIAPGSALAERVIRASEAEKGPRELSKYLEEQIYDGFPSDADMTLCESFHGASWEDRLPITKRFDDERLRALGRRIVYDERPDLLSDVDRRSEELEIATRLMSAEEDLPWCTIPQAIADSRSLIETLADADAARLGEYVEHCEARKRKLLLQT